jgi:hypothetical protein
MKKKQLIITDKQIKNKLLITKKKKSNNDIYMTVQDLLDYIYKNDIDLNSAILVERIEDFYFKKHKWKTVNKKSFEFEGEEDKYFKIFSYRKYKGDKKLYLTAHY